MVEAIGGKMELAQLELFGSWVPLRTWRELIELRKAIREERRLKKGGKGVTYDMIKKNLAKFIRDQDQAIGHAGSAMDSLLRLLHNVALDVHDMKKVIKLMLEEDTAVAKGGSNIISQERAKMQRLQASVNKKLRDMSDTLGALTRE